MIKTSEGRIGRHGDTAWEDRSHIAGHCKARETDQKTKIDTTATAAVAFKSGYLCDWKVASCSAKVSK